MECRASLLSSSTAAWSLNFSLVVGTPPLVGCGVKADKRCTETAPRGLRGPGWSRLVLMMLIPMPLVSDVSKR